ncbi:TPA: hypothetical protein ACXJPN_001669 [Serratia marcescens]
MAKREDSSGYCYHWVKANMSLRSRNQWYNEAFHTLLNILTSETLKSGRMLNISHGHSCICFTETPIGFIKNDQSKYQPFGLEFVKSDIYKLGGKHVIYCTYDEFLTLPDHLKWRYVRHEPLLRDRERPYGIDFTWEREIRINSGEVILFGESEITFPSCIGNIDFSFTNILVPNEIYVERLMGELSKYYEDTFKEYSLEKPENSHLYDEFFVSLMKE